VYDTHTLAKKSSVKLMTDCLSIIEVSQTNKTFRPYKPFCNQSFMNIGAGKKSICKYLKTHASCE
jgi:hypothetical protein